MKNPLAVVKKGRIYVAGLFRPYIDRLSRHKMVVAGVVLAVTFPWRHIITHIIQGTTHGH